MRGVTSLFLMYFRKVSISTHTPHARRDTPAAGIAKGNLKFQLTRLMRGVTILLLLLLSSPLFQLTRLMRGVTNCYHSAR